MNANIKLPEELPSEQPVIDSKSTTVKENTTISDAKGPVLFGLFLIFGVFAGLTIWAATAPLESAVSAPGSVVVEGERKIVQHLEGGIIKEILVKDGDYVRMGDVLIKLDDTRARAVVEIYRGQLTEYLALAARLDAESQGADEILYADPLLENPDQKTQEVLLDQRKLFDARRRSLNGQIDILNQRISQYREEIAGLTAQQKAREGQIALFKQEIEGLEKLQATGNIAVNFVLDKKRQLEELQGEEGKFKADVARAKQGIGEAELSIEQLTKKQHEEVVGQLREVRANIADMRERLVASDDTLTRTIIRSPATGIVLGLNTHTVGGVIGPGVEILQIVPQGEELVFEVRVETTDIDDIAVGQRTTVRLTAFSFRHSFILDGVVINASADALTDPATGAKYYAVTIKVPNDQLLLLHGNTLLPGMPVQALIKTGNNTLLGYIMAPLRDTLADAFIEK